MLEQTTFLQSGSEFESFWSAWGALGPLSAFERASDAESLAKLPVRQYLE